jgi:uncharacterized RDD family membrane protein YckC
MPLSTASAGDAFRAEPPPIFAPPPPPAPPLVADVPPSAASGPDVAYSGDDLRRYPKATFLDRMAAFAIDAILVAIVYGFVVEGILVHRFNDDGAYPAMLIAYHIAFWAWKSTTLGGIICNVRMVRTTGEDPRFIDALVRGLTAIFSVVALGIGCFWMISDPDKQMWHDKIGGTIVVKVPREKVLR